MTTVMELIGLLGKEAAYRPSRILPPKPKKKRRPKRRTSGSRTFKVRTKKDAKKSDKAAKTSAGNSQTPYRYGRKVKG